MGKRISVVVVILACLIALSSVQAQTIDSTRVEINRLVRDMVNEPNTSKWLPDTTLDRLINYAQFQVMMALGEKTNIDTTRVVTNREQVMYALPENSIRGMIIGINRRVETDQGGGETALNEINMDQIGRLGEGVIPASYAIRGDHFFLGTRPSGGDTLMVYYVPKPQNLLAADSSLYVAEEDRAAIAYLTSAWVLMRDHQVTMANWWMDMYIAHLRQKGIGVTEQVPQQ